MLKKKSGITLIALVITIIVLLILAGISIQMVVAKNGVIGGATDASEETRDNEEGERVKLAVDDSYLEGKGTLSKRSIREALSNEFGEEKVTDETLIGEEEGPWTFKGERKTYKINEYGEVDEYIDIDNDTDTGTDSNADISKYVDVGDYVDYHPTYMDKNGKSLVSEDKLTYKSKKGEGSSHGNGSKEQVFKATENEKWRVLDIKDDGTLEIISENIISNDSNGKYNLKLFTEIGYLYAEQEINEICKIYGYGYGCADDGGGSYTVGGPLDAIELKKIDETGARSLDYNDLENLTGVSCSERKEGKKLIGFMWHYPTILESDRRQSNNRLQYK